MSNATTTAYVGQRPTWGHQGSPRPRHQDLHRHHLHAECTDRGVLHRHVRRIGGAPNLDAPPRPTADRPALVRLVR